MPYDRQWVADAISTIEADFNRSADTHLIRLDLPKLGDIGLEEHGGDPLGTTGQSFQWQPAPYRSLPACTSD